MDNEATARAIPAEMSQRLIVALDVPTIAQARHLISQLGDQVSFYKIGLWLAFAEGIDGLLADLARAGKQVFLDCKMFDIGQTVAQGVARAVERGVSIVTVHGDRTMIEAAVRARAGSQTRIFAISVLTSLNDAALREMGYGVSVAELIARRARMAAELGCDGMIASPHDQPNEMRRLAGSQRLLIATPGVRPAGSATDDHARHATPAAAIRAGADYLVIGRPIIAAPDPAQAAAAIIAEMNSAS